MKTITICLFALISTVAFGQRVDFDSGSVTVYSDSLTLDQSFELTDKLVPWQLKYYDRYVVREGVTYYRPGLRLFRKQKIYIVDYKTGGIYEHKRI